MSIPRQPWSEAKLTSRIGADESRPAPGEDLSPPATGAFSGLAIAAFVVGLCGIVPVAFVLGIVARVDIRQRHELAAATFERQRERGLAPAGAEPQRQRGEGLAATAVGLSVVWLVVGWIALLVINNGVIAPTADAPTAGPVPTQPTPTFSAPAPAVPPPSPPTQAPLSALKVGDCLDAANISGTPTPSTVQVDDCAAQHMAQIFAKVKVSVAAGSGQDAAEAEGDSDCLRAEYTTYHDPMQLSGGRPALYYLAPPTRGSAFREGYCAFVFFQWTKQPLPSPQPLSAYKPVQLRFLAMEAAVRVPVAVFTQLQGRAPWRTDQVYSIRAAAADRAEATWLQSVAVQPVADAKNLADDDLAEATWLGPFNAARNATEFTKFIGQGDPAEHLDADAAQLRTDLGLPAHPQNNLS